MWTTKVILIFRKSDVIIVTNSTMARSKQVARRGGQHNSSSESVQSTTRSTRSQVTPPDPAENIKVDISRTTCAVVCIGYMFS